MLLLTRPYQQSLQMGAFLKEADIPFFIEPMLTIVPLKRVALEGYDTLIITSQNALEILSNLPLSINIYCVGESLRDSLKEKGVLSVNAFDSSLNLVEHLKKYPSTHFKKILYAAGQSRTIEMESILKPLGYNIETEVLYRTDPPNEFSKPLINLLEKNIIQMVCFFSQKTAESFIDLMRRHHIDKLYPSLIAFSFSEAISKTLRPLAWKEILTTSRPSMNSFWQLIKNHVG